MCTIIYVTYATILVQFSSIFLSIISYFYHFLSNVRIVTYELVKLWPIPAQRTLTHSCKWQMKVPESQHALTWGLQRDASSDKFPWEVRNKCGDVVMWWWSNSWGHASQPCAPATHWVLPVAPQRLLCGLGRGPVSLEAFQKWMART